MKVYVLRLCTAGRPGDAYDESVMGVFATPEAARREVLTHWPEAPDWELGGATIPLLEVEPYSEPEDCNHPCGGTWWGLTEYEVWG